jgi:Rod binding domain-containing protein
MNLSALTATALAARPDASVAIEDLASHPGLSEKDKLAKVSQQFEAALLRQILTDARKPVFASRFTSTSAVDGIYQDLITNQLAESISQSGEFGLARSLQSQLDPRSSTPSSAADSAANAPQRPAPAPSLIAASSPSFQPETSP